MHRIHRLRVDRGTGIGSGVYSPTNMFVIHWTAGSLARPLARITWISQGGNATGSSKTLSRAASCNCSATRSASTAIDCDAPTRNGTARKLGQVALT